MSFDSAPGLHTCEESFRESYGSGVGAFASAAPKTLEEWARQHFYLSAESSYVEQKWVPWPFQRGILACLSNDDIREVNLKKSARVGYTKALLAFIGYTASRTRRNQVLWQPTDDDAVGFVKSELDPMLRDVAAMRPVFPAYLSRHKDNTLDQKTFLGSILYVKGGKAAKNYRRISADNALIDEADAFDTDVEKEGDPIMLAAKRIEGATFPKLVVGSTPKLRGFSNIDKRFAKANERFTYQIPCPECATLHALSWGGKDVPHGFKWLDHDPASVRHLCPHCGCLIGQGQYLTATEQGVWVNERGDLWLHFDGRFTTPDGAAAAIPEHIALHVWTAYSPNVSWTTIVDQFITAHTNLVEGDDTKMKAFVNTTLGECWEGEVERTEVDELKTRAEPFALRFLPRDCLLLLAGADTQDNRIELGVWGYGRGGEMWSIDHRVFFGNPALPELWAEVETFLRTQQYQNAFGIPQRIYATAIDSGGHHSDAVYAFAHRLKALNVHAIKGSSSRERSIDNGNVRVSYRWNGKLEKHGPTLWHVGTNLAKDRFQSRLGVATPGPGYVHLARDMSDEWFKQLAGEIRATRRMQGGSESRWTPNRARVEVKDCLTYAIWLEERLDLWQPRRATFWKQLEATVQPEGDLFAPAPEPPKPAAPPRVKAPRVLPPAPVGSPFTRGGWGIGA